MKCEICGVEYKQITSTHLKNKHNVLVSEYKLKYPEAKLMSDDTLKFLSEKCKIQHIDEKGDFGFRNGHKINEGKEPSFKGETKEINDMLRKLSEHKTGLKMSDEQKWKLSKITKQQYDDGTRKKLYGKDNPMYGRKLTKEHVEKLHSSTRSGLKKTRPEIEIEKVISSYGFKYTGDRSFWVNFIDGKRKNPDFKHDKLNYVIEVYGDYWHRGDDPDDIITKYREIGFECLVLWESEIYKYGVNLRPNIEEFINE